jgi:pimeloyl-ACP methyl ester carboxylesterase
MATTIAAPRVAIEIETETDAVVSRDGTTIGYRRIGDGPGLVVLHGAMESSRSHLQLAKALADTFTVYLPDRRGRGMSGPYPAGYSVQTDIEDMDALLAKTGAGSVFGVSSGALIWLHAARVLPVIKKAAIFEPPLLIGGDLSALTRRFDAEIARGKVAAALITGMKAARLGPPILDLIPRWLLERMTQTMLAAADRSAAPDDVTVRMLAPTLHYDFQLILDSQGRLDPFGEIRADLLLLGGSKSPAFLTASLDALERVVPHAKRVELAGLGHSASGNTGDPMTGKGADPQRIARELRNFFA